MSKFINTAEITINSSVENIWQALTNSDQIEAYLGNMKVVSDWKQGSSVVYTHYEKDGSITVWKEMQMLWTGVIEVFIPNEQLGVRYSDQSAGITYESYVLTAVNPNEIKVSFTQEAISQQIADNYKEGNEYTLSSLKKYVEQTKQFSSMTPITVSTIVNSSLEKTWQSWVGPEHITKWNFADPSWECPKATNDPKTGGKFSSTMAAKDGSTSFDFEGVYSNVIPYQLIEYGLGDGRKVSIKFEELENGVQVTETFDPETENPVEMQLGGWQSILDNFKKHTESLN